MKILKLLNKKNFSIILSFFFLFSLKVDSNEPVDIWDIDSKKIIIENSTEEKTISTNSVYDMQSEKKKKFEKTKSTTTDWRRHFWTRDIHKTFLRKIFFQIFSAKPWRQILPEKLKEKLFFGILVQKLGGKFCLKK